MHYPPTSVTRITTNIEDTDGMSKQRLTPYNADATTGTGILSFRYSNPGIPNSGIPGSRPIFSIPNPGIGDALIPGLRKMNKIPEI